jgi:hypothetical protein
MLDAATNASTSVIEAAEPARSPNYEFIRVSNMNPITAFLVFVLLAAAAGTGYLVNFYLGAALFVVAVLVGTSLKMANV